MLGAIIGDIVGSRWEFNPTNDYNFQWLSSHNSFLHGIISIYLPPSILQSSAGQQGNWLSALRHS